jgi:hypothetical protein
MERTANQLKMPTKQVSFRRNWFGKAWLLLSISLLLHIIDEATHNFLQYYNQVAPNLRERYRLPVPSFTFTQWITGLIIVVTVVLLLTPLAYQGKKLTRVLAWPYSIIMLFNGLLHIVGSFYYGLVLPGTYSAPLLLGCSVMMLVQINKRRQ